MSDTPLSDPTAAPDPAGGWSSAVRAVPGAVIVPATTPDMIQAAGVFDAEGAYVHEAVLWRGRPLMVPPPLAQAGERLPGRWIWGGVLLNHFGHFLTESTGRLWGIDAVEGAVDGIVFVSKREGEEAEGEAGIKPFHRAFLDMAGIGLPVRIVARPTRVDLLEVPGQGFGIGPMATGTARFRDFMRRRFAREVAPEGGPDLYISRSALGPARGGILAEDRLEGLLAAEGYEIWHPERHGLSEQVARYKAARRVVALDGSALHLLAMAAEPGTRVAVVRRRNSGVSEGIVAHLAAFLGRAPDVVDVVRQDWIRSDRTRADRFSIGELDFPALGAALAAAGYIAGARPWPRLTDVEAGERIAALERALSRGKLRFSPRPRAGKRRKTPEERAARRARRRARTAPA